MIWSQPGKPGKFLKMVESVFGPLRADVTRWTCANMESFRPHVLLYHQFNIVLARDMHDRYGVGLCFAPLCPSVPTNDYPPHLLVGYHLPCCGLNMKLHRLLRQVMFKPQLAPDSAVQALRAEAGLRPLAFEDLWDVYYSRCASGRSPTTQPSSHRPRERALAADAPLPPPRPRSQSICAWLGWVAASI